jgi:glycosyltransferase involved in cell wall biosynthesis
MKQSMEHGMAPSETAADATVPAPLLVHVFPTFAVGGAQMRFTAIANHFAAAFRHIVVSLDGDLACRENLRPDLDVAFPKVVATKGVLPANVWRFRRLLRQWRPDLLTTHNWGAIEFAMANTPPVTRHLHVVDGFGPEEQSRRLRRRVLLRRMVLKRTPVLLPSRTLVSIARDVWKLPPPLVRYLPNGVDLKRFAPIDSADDGNTADAAPSTSTVPVIGTVAALREEKNLSRLLRAFALVAASTPARLVVVGDGPRRRDLAALASRLGIADQVEFTGHRVDTPSFYTRFDVFVLSSDTEQMPLSVLEAMASRLPVVATDVGDIRSMVSAENAPFVVAPDDTALAAALRTLLSNPLMRYTIGAANLSKARLDFDEAAMFDAYGALWRGAAGAR